MTRIIRQKYSGRTFTVIREDDEWIVMRPLPDDNGPDITMPKHNFAAKWENADGTTSREDRAAEKAVLDALTKPATKKRGRR